MDRLEKLQQRESQLKARIASAQARDKKQRRKNETRQKILVGAFFLEQYKKHGKMAALIKRMDEYLIRDKDRALFDLPPMNTVNAKK